MASIDCATATGLRFLQWKQEGVTEEAKLPSRLCCATLTIVPEPQELLLIVLLLNSPLLNHISLKARKPLSERQIDIYCPGNSPVQNMN